MGNLYRLALLAALGTGGACAPPPGAGLYVPMPDAAPRVDAGAIADFGYPTGNVGGRPRTALLPGQTFPNLSLQGIRSVDSIATAEWVPLAELYDPSGARYDLLHVLAIFFWCPHCNNETKALAQLAEWRADRRVAVIQIALQGYDSAAPGWNELQKWVRDHDCDFPVVVDGQGQELGQYFAVDSVPINIVVDPRTMEILAVDVGDVGDVQAYEQRYLSLF